MTEKVETESSSRPRTIRTPVYYLSRLKLHVENRTLGARVRLAVERLLGRIRSSRWERLKRKRQHIDVKIECAVTMRLYFDNVISKDIFCYNHEKNERRFLCRFLRKGDAFLDIGANMGLYSLLASKLAGPTGQVYAFEPDPNTYRRLLLNLELNGLENVSCHQIALSDREEVRDMKISSGAYDAYNSFGTPVRGEGTFEKLRITCATCDGFLENEGLADRRIAYLKVDVEGWETRVLQGAEALLRRDDAPVLQIEFNDQAAKAVDTPCVDLYRWLEQLGFTMYTYDARKNVLVNLPLQDHYVYENVLAIKRYAEVRDRLE